MRGEKVIIEPMIKAILMVKGKRKLKNVAASVKEQTAEILLPKRVKELSKCFSPICSGTISLSNFNFIYIKSHFVLKGALLVDDA
ncbi:MAG: hypothetical protein U5J96_04705 [Ignavibacteriaceae bacterium]|nr:hypothetical protein [Ignavibacteriaceae bacterium]